MAERDQARIEGNLEQLRAKLKEEFGVSNLKKADQLLDQLTEEEKTLQEKLNKEMKELEESYHEQLEKDS